MNKFIQHTLPLLLVFSINVAMAQKPIPVCFQGLTIDLTPATSTATLAANVFNAGSKDSLYPENQLTYRLQVPPPAQDAAYDASKTVAAYTFDCVGYKSVALWVGNPAGKWAFCSTYIDIQNNMGAVNPPACPPIISSADCLQASPDYKKISLKINGIDGCDFTPTSIFYTVKLIKGGLAGPQQKLKGKEICLKIGNEFTVAKMVAENKNVLNGISTLDLVIISQGILGNSPLTPLQKIAADINSNGSITTSDLVLLRKAILGKPTAFLTPDNCWKFVAKKTLSDFPSPLIVTKDTTLEYLAIKLGDMNGNASCALAAPRSESTFYLAEKQLFAGEPHRIFFEKPSIDGYQFTLNYDSNALEVIELDENSTLLENGKIITSQLQGEQFFVDFKAKKTLRLSDAIAFSNDKLVAEVYENKQTSTLNLAFTEVRTVKKMELLQNQPNPFPSNTNIAFLSPEAIEYTLTIHDLHGRVIQKTTATSLKGRNIIDINLQEKGVFFYTLHSKDFSATKKMICW